MLLSQSDLFNKAHLLRHPVQPVPLIVKPGLNPCAAAVLWLRVTPPVSIVVGKWLAEAGFAVGIGVSLKVLDGCLLLIPGSREEKRLRAMEQQLKAQQLELERAKKRMIEMLA